MTLPVYDRHGVQVHHGDCLDVMRTLPDASVHAIVTDPPAGIRFMGRAWDSDMGGRHSWVAWLSERMREAHRVLKPGGYGLVWALPRTSHWTAWALEDAGFEVRDCIVHLFGSGFPKSLDVSKAIDKAGGDPLAFRRFARAYAAAVEAAPMTHSDIDRHLGVKSSSCYWVREDHRGKLPPRHHWEQVRDLLGLDAQLEVLYDEAVRADRVVAGPAANAVFSPTQRVLDAGTPVSDGARQWDGWGTALKPAAEHWWLIRKPMPGTVAACVLEHGTGALNIDGCRVAHASDADLAESASKNPGREDVVTSEVYGAGRPQQSVNTSGRWPSNVVLTHAPDCVHDRDEAPSWIVETFGCAPGCPVAELDAQSGVTKDGTAVKRNRNGEQNAHGIYGSHVRGPDTDQTFGGQGGASRFFPQFRWEAKAPTSERPVVGGKAHETVKPLGLMRWMVRLVCAPGGTVLDCFAGSGTTGQAARAEGMRAVLIEQDADHIDKIRARLDARPKTTASEAKSADGEPMDLLDLLDGTAS